MDPKTDSGLLPRSEIPPYSAQELPWEKLDNVAVLGIFDTLLNYLVHFCVQPLGRDYAVVSCNGWMGYLYHIRFTIPYSFSQN